MYLYQEKELIEVTLIILETISKKIRRKEKHMLQRSRVRGKGP
jgi:hypothetical protein